MPHTSRKRSSRGSGNGARFKRSSLGKAETTRNEARFNVTYVWGPHDMTPRRYITPDRRKAMAIARRIAGEGARIVLVKKGDFKRGQKLIVDLSSVGGAA
jgi:hypothetical protein